MLNGKNEEDYKTRNDFMEHVCGQESEPKNILFSNLISKKGYFKGPACNI